MCIVLLASMVIKHIYTKAPKSWMFLCSHLRLDLSRPLSYPNYSVYSWSLCTLLPLQVFPGTRVQGTANRPTPSPMMSPGLYHFLKTDGKWLTQTCSFQPTTREMWNLLPYTHHTLSRPSLSWLFPPVSFTASRLCLVKITTLLDFWGCLWLNESISNLLHTRFYCT